MAGKMRGRKPKPVNSLGAELARLRMERGVSRETLGLAGRRVELSRCRHTVLLALEDRAVRAFLKSAQVSKGDLLSVGWWVLGGKVRKGSPGQQDLFSATCSGS